MHLAWALGVNMVALFGPGDIDKFGHKRGNIINIAAQGITCSPCILNYRYRDNCADNLCMRNIEVNEVIKAIEMLSVVKNG
jgi:ADP-heptose:LPS heptosyltransferase